MTTQSNDEITLAEAKEQLGEWKNASLAVAKGQSYTIGDRTLSRVHSSEIRKMLNYWSDIVVRLKDKAAGNHRKGFSLAKFT